MQPLNSQPMGQQGSGPLEPSYQQQEHTYLAPTNQEWQNQGYSESQSQGSGLENCNPLEGNEMVHENQKQGSGENWNHSGEAAEQNRMEYERQRDQFNFLDMGYEGSGGQNTFQHVEGQDGMPMETIQPNQIICESWETVEECSENQVLGQIWIPMPMKNAQPIQMGQNTFQGTGWNSMPLEDEKIHEGYESLQETWDHAEPMETIQQNQIEYQSWETVEEVVKHPGLNGSLSGSHQKSFNEDVEVQGVFHSQTGKPMPKKSVQNQIEDDDCKVVYEAQRPSKVPGSQSHHKRQVPIGPEAFHHPQVDSEDCQVIYETPGTKRSCHQDFRPFLPTRVHKRGSYDHHFRNSKKVAMGPGCARGIDWGRELAPVPETIAPNVQEPELVPMTAVSKTRGAKKRPVKAPRPSDPITKEEEDSLMREFFIPPPVETTVKEPKPKRAKRKEVITDEDEEALLALLES